MKFLFEILIKIIVGSVFGFIISASTNVVVRRLNKKTEIFISISR